MQNQLTEAEAWRMIGEAFEAKVEHPTLEHEVELATDIAYDGLCSAIAQLTRRYAQPYEQEKVMSKKIYELVDAHGWGAYLHPLPDDEGAAEARATLAYLFAEEAAA